MLSRRTVLVVDDEPAVLEYLGKHLRESGCSVILAGSGEAALAQVEGMADPPDLLVADLVLPGISGFSLADRLKETYPDLKTLFISGHTGAEYFRQMGMDSGEIPFLQKPFAARDFLEKVEQLLSSTAGKSELGGAS